MTKAGTQPGVHHVLTMLAVIDLERAVRFYRDPFGWPSRVETPVVAARSAPMASSSSNE